MTRLSQLTHVGTEMTVAYSIKIAAFGVAALALVTSHSTAFASGKPQLYPICAFGRIIFAPFPGENEHDGPKQAGACHLARLDGRLRLIEIRPNRP